MAGKSTKGRIRVRKPGGGYYYRKKPSTRGRTKKGAVYIHKEGQAYKCTPTKVSKVAFKKCVVSTLSKKKFTTAKSATKAFRAAVKSCRPVLCATGKCKKSATGKAKKKTYRKSNTPPLPGGYFGKKDLNRQSPPSRASQAAKDAWLRLPPHQRF